MTSNCEEVIRLLDLAADRPLTPAESATVADHARACAACAALVRLENWLELGTTDQLEAAVPDDVASAVWDRLAAGLDQRAPLPIRPKARGRRPAWTHLAMAAGLAALALLSGWLGVENRRLRSDLNARAPEAVATATAEPATASTARGRELPWGLGGLTAGEVASELRRVPPQTPVLPASAVRRLLRDNRSPLARPPRGTLAEAAREGLRAADALALLARLDPSTRLPVSRSDLARLESGVTQ